MTQTTCCLCVLLVVQTQNNGVNWVAVADWLCQTAGEMKREMIEEGGEGRGGRGIRRDWLKIGAWTDQAGEEN